MNAQCRKSSRDGEGSKNSKKRRKSPRGSGTVDVSGKGIRKAQLQQSRFRALKDEELQGPPSRTRASLKRRLHEPSPTKLKVDKKPNQQDLSRNGDKTHIVEPKDNPGTDIRAFDTEQPSNTPSITQPLPEKHTLALIIDTLQRKDVYEIFAEPVDPEEVKDYYEIIEEPMDFGTMRAKLHEGMYTSLEQFERDVFLITGNAMHFNSSGTIFFRQAHGIHKLAKRVFHVLRTNPENFESEFSGTKRRSCRRSHDETNDLNLLKTSETNRGVEDGKTCGPVEVDRRSTYKPRLDLENKNCPKFLVHLNQPDHNYRQSLMHFVKDLGPTAQMVAKRKLQRLSGDASVSHQPRSQIPFGQTFSLNRIQDSAAIGIMKTGGIATWNQNQISRDHELSGRNGTVMTSANTKNVLETMMMPGWPPHRPCVSSRFALDLGLLKSKMGNNNKDSSFTQKLHIEETTYKPFDAKDLVALQL